MSRFDIDDDGEPHITAEMWDWNLRRALAGKKGQAKLREFREALLAVPGHRLVEDQIATLDGDVCAIGAFAAYKRTQKGQTWALATAELNLEYHPVREATWSRTGTWEDETDAWTTQLLGMKECGLNATLAWHLAYANDEGEFAAFTPEARWWKAYVWTCEQLGESPDHQHEPTAAANGGRP